MTILKFGGTSMGSVEALQNVSNIINEKVKTGENPVVVCSAMGGVTNDLLCIGELAEKHEGKEALDLFETIKFKHFHAAQDLGILKEFKSASQDIFSDLENLIKGIGMIHELSERSIAYLSSFGEKLSTRILTLLLQKNKLPAQQFDANFIKTKGKSYWEDEVDWDKTKKAITEILRPKIEQKIIPIITGFFGINNKGITALLGRGGSDFSGAILAVCLNVEKLEIWTDVDGFLSADPRIVKEAKIIEEIGFEEASELCFFGAKVLHPKTIRPIIEKDGEVWIKNTSAPQNNGTRITARAAQNCHEVISISSKKVAMISLDIFTTQKSKSQIFEEIFSLANQKKVFIDMIAASEAQISFCIEAKYLTDMSFFQKLKTIGDIEIFEDREVICIVSPKDVQGRIGVAADIFAAIAKAKTSIEMYSQNASEIAQLIVVKSDVAPQSIARIHEVLVAGDCKIKKTSI